MILLKDNRGIIHFSKRLEIAAISETPFGEYHVKITDEWYKNPIVPFDGISIGGILPPEVTASPGILKLYISGMAVDRNMGGSLYLSIFVDNVAEMDSRYDEFGKGLHVTI